MTDDNPPQADRDGTIRHAGLTTMSAAVSVLLILLVALLWSTIVAPFVILALATVNLVSVLCLRRKRTMVTGALHATLFVAQIAAYGYAASFYPSSIPHRMLQVGIILLAGAAVLAAVLTATRKIQAVNAVLFAGLLAFSLFVAEAAFGYIEGRRPSWSSPQWEGPVQRHPELGQYYPPFARIRTYYPGDPRDYFDQESVAETSWNLAVSEGNAAGLEFTGTGNDVIRVNITLSEGNPPWQINLTQGLSMVEGQSYRISFEARADGLRSILNTVIQAHEPWENLGLYQQLELTSDWQEFSADFTANAGDENARIEFDLGGSNHSVEVRNVNLVTLPDGTPVEVKRRAPRHYIEYAINDRGCRGPDYVVPRPPNTRRILALGDSFTLGVGVQEGDVFTSRLERMLNTRAEASGAEERWEVINCGLSGFSTREERILYEMIGAEYEPEVVLLTMVQNDDRSWVDDVEAGYNYSPGTFARVFQSWRMVQQWRHQRPVPDFSGSLEEVLKLQELAAAQGARVAVVAFRHGTGPDWDSYLRTVPPGLEAAGIPFVDLLRALYDGYTWQETIVMNYVDAHPNEIAHRIAAEQIFYELLEPAGLIDPSENR